MLEVCRKLLLAGQKSTFRRQMQSQHEECQKAHHAAVRNKWKWAAKVASGGKTPLSQRLKLPAWTVDADACACRTGGGGGSGGGSDVARNQASSTSSLPHHASAPSTGQYGHQHQDNQEHQQQMPRFTSPSPTKPSGSRRSSSGGQGGGSSGSNPSRLLSRKTIHRQANGPSAPPESPISPTRALGATRPKQGAEAGLPGQLYVTTEGGRHSSSVQKIMSLSARAS